MSARLQSISDSAALKSGDLIMTEDHDVPLSELLRPKTLQELALPEIYISQMQKMLDSGDPDNMLFYGPPGSGKTSAARIFLKTRGDYRHMTVDGSKDIGVDYKIIESFASTHGLFVDDPGLKLIFIDNGDFITKPRQAAFRVLIENSSDICRFIVAANDVTKIDKGVRSRLLSLDFAMPKAEVPGIVERIQHCVSEKMAERGWSFNRERLNQIVLENSSDLRTMVNQLQVEFRS
jgi:DNA polymerase III delta prime subunit